MNDEFKTEVLESVGSIAVLKLPAPGFDELSLDEKLVAYHLAHAAIAGDSITWDQNSKHGLALRNLFLDLSEHTQKMPGLFREKLLDYSKKIMLHHGNHDAWSTKKFLPEFTKMEFGGMLNLAFGNSAKSKLSNEMEQVIFDPGFEPMLIQKSPKNNEDIITASSMNYYQGVTLKDLEGFKDDNPNNSTVVKEKGRVVEKVWRAGNPSKKIQPGMYSPELKNISNHLGQAIKHAPDEQKKHLAILKQYFEEGTAQLFVDFNIAWATSNPKVDQILGFIEEYRDVRGKKGFFEGMAFFVDKKSTGIIHKIAGVAQKLESETPWKKEYRKTWNNTPVANAITLITGTGGGGPFCWAGVNLPNAQWIREKHGSKSVVIANVTYASRHAFAKKALGEFLERQEDIDNSLRYLDVKGPVLVTLHEIVGHGSGKASQDLKGDPREYLKELYSTLEEARAELCALHHIYSKTLFDTGVLPDGDCWKSVYLGYATGGITQLKSLKNETELHEDHYRANQLIVEYLRRKVKCLEFYKKNNKTYARVLDYDKMKAGVAELLAEIQRIKSNGDYASLKKLVDEYAVHFDHALRDEVVSRTEQINLPSLYAYVMPIPTLKKDASGKVTNVELNYPSNLLNQAKSWKKISEQEQNAH